MKKLGPEFEGIIDPVYDKITKGITWLFICIGILIGCGIGYCSNVSTKISLI